MKKILLIISSFLITANVFADQPKDWQLGFQNPASDGMRDIVNFHNNLLLPIIIAISVFVLFLMLYACVRFRASANPNPSKRTHNVTVEILWTLIPCLILIVMAVPSFKILYKQDTIPKADLTIKAIGYQWYWGYEYPDENIIFDSYMIEEKDLRADQPRLLAVDNEVVVPVNKVVKVLITANDVLHAWALPSFGVKRDAVPGRINETWFKAEKEGTYYGQCSELCGIKHAFMPITVNVVTEEEYKLWLEEAKQKFAKENLKNNIKVAKKFMAKSLLPAINRQKDEDAHDFGIVLHDIIKMSKKKGNHIAFTCAKTILHEVQKDRVFYCSKNFRIYPKGQGLLCNRKEGIKAGTFVERYLGELFSPWRWFEKTDAVKVVQKKLGMK